MNCTHCKAELPDGSKFCTECGTPTAQTVSCSFCGESNPAGAKFCQGCGKPLVSASAAALASAPLASPRAAPGATGGTGDQASFAFLLSDEKLRAVKDQPIKIPYGCAAVVLVDGVVTRVQTQVPAKLEAPGAIGEFFSLIADAARALVGQRQQEVKTYIVSDFRQLPLITYSHPLPLPDAPDAKLRFEFWLDAQDNPGPDDAARLGVFFQRVMQGRSQLSNEEFRQAAMTALQTALAQFPETTLQNPEQRDELLAMLRRTTGISGKCLFLKGKNSVRRYFEVSTLHQPVACKGCGHEYGHEYMNKLKFCEECGTSMAGLDWVSGITTLQAADGRALVVRLSVLADTATPFDEPAVVRAVLNVLRPVISKKDVSALLEGAELTSLAALLNRDLSRTFRGALSDFVVLDLKLADQDWFFKTDALVDEEVRKIEAQQRLLAVESRDLDYRDAAFAVRLRSLAQENAEAVTERRAGLEAARSHAALDVEERKLEARTDLDLERIDADVDVERRRMQARVDVESARIDADTNEQQAALDHAAGKQQFERDKENLLRGRGLERDLRREDRVDEVDQATHEMQLEKRVAGHDIELADMTGEAQSRARRREIGDEAFAAEEALRLRAKEREQLGNLEEDLVDRQTRRAVDVADRDSQRQLEKMRAMAEMEANMARQDQDFELAKMQNLKGLDAAQILAMQAAQLAKAGGQGAAAEIVKSIAESQAAAAGGAGREDLYKQMLEMKDQATSSAIDAHKAAMEAVLKTNAEMARVATAASANSNDGYKEAAKIAQSTNEKSMDAMQKVASAAAGRKTTEAKDSAPEPKLFKCVACSQTYEGKKKFCPQCGAPQDQAEA